MKETLKNEQHQKIKFKSYRKKDKLGLAPSR